MAPQPWTDADTEHLKAWHAAGKSLHALHVETGWAKSTLSKRAKALGLVWDRADTAAATQAKVLDGKARRAALNLALLEDAEKLRGQLWTKTMAFNFGGKDNTYNEHELTQPTFADQLKIMQSVGIAIDRSLKLDVHDSGNNTVVMGLLQRTAEALGLTDATDTAPPAE